MDFYRYVAEEERTIEASWQQNLRSSLLDGHLPLRNIPRLLPTASRVYLSSVASDSECERRYLIENVYIKLREYCRAAHGIEFQVIDLRSGLDRQSQHVLPFLSHLSKFEIQQCQRSSTGPCFVALIGQRYCNEAIPPASIGKEQFLSLREALRTNGQDGELLEKFYKLDENPFSPQFLLQPSLRADTDKWIETERKLSELLTQAADFLQDGDWSNPPSDLHADLIVGLFSVERQKFRDDNCLLMEKTITDINQRLERKRASRFIDLYTGTNQVDRESQKALHDLSEAARSYLTKNNIFSFNIKWSEPSGIASYAHKEYLTSLGNTFFEQIRRHVDINMIEWGHYPYEELYVEVQQHWLAAKANVDHFQEQGQYVHAIKEYVTSQSASPLIVHGVSGCGKSSLLSYMASTASDESSSLKVILRHLGHTPASHDLEQLLHSLIKQLCEVMGLAYTALKTFLESKAMFKNILESGYCNCTLLVLIDGLDRLAAEGYDQIDWLPQKLSANIKMVISTREDDSKGTLCKLQSRYNDNNDFLQVGNMLPEICERIIKQRLQEVERTVTDNQWKVISKCLHECPYPLYIELAFQQIKGWRSFDYPYLPATIPGLCAALLEVLETKYDRVVVSHVVSILTCSLYGLTEAEMEDILSLDDELLSQFTSPATKILPVQRIPCLVWSRLKSDLVPYLSVWKVDNVNLITWRYTQLADAIRERYLNDVPFFKKIHSLVADFFLGKWSGINKKPNRLITPWQGKSLSSVIECDVPQASHRNVITQPLVISGHGTNARVNVRKLNELAYHLASSGQVDELCDKVLFSYDWIRTKLSVMPMARLLSDYDFYGDTETSLVRQALDDIKEEFSADLLGVELTGRLIAYYSQHPKIRQLIDQCDLAAMKRCSVVPQLQLYQSPGSFLQHEFKGRLQVCPNLQVTIISKSEATYLVDKHEEKTTAVFHNLQSFEDSQLLGLPGEGPISVTPNQERLVAKRGRFIESYQVDSHKKEFTIATENGPISCSAVSDTYFVFSINKKTGPYVVDLKYPSLVHTFNHHSTAIAVSDDCEMMVCNNGQSLHVYELPLMTRHCVIPTDDTACKMLFLSDHNKFCVLSSSHYVRLYAVNRLRKTASCSVIGQEPSIVDIHLSPDKSHLLIHSKKYLRVVSLTDMSTKCTISQLSHCSSSHDIVSAHFNYDGSRVVAARERTIGVFDSLTGEEVCQAEVPYPCDVWSCLTCAKVNKAVTVLENGLIHVWDISLAASDKKHKNNYYPGEVTSFAVCADGSKMAVCNKNYPDAKVVDLKDGSVEQRLYDSFAAGSQPLSVQISPHGRFVVTRCANDVEGTINWKRLRSDYVWSSAANRVTHFFINCYSVTFSPDDGMVVALSCIDYTPADPSNKFFVALCYGLKGEHAEEHKVTLPDGDIIGEPLVYSDKKWLVCLVQPCIKTKFSGMLMEQRVDNVQAGFNEYTLLPPSNVSLYTFDLFTSSARDRKSVNCSELVREEKTFFVNMREMTREYQLLLMYARGKLPPYKDDGTVDTGHPMAKGFLLYDLLKSSVLHHVSSYLDVYVPADSFLISKHLTYTLHDLSMYDGRTGEMIHSILPEFQPCGVIPPVLLLDGNYIAVITRERSVVKILNSRNSVERCHFLLHGEAIDMQIGKDDRTLYVSTSDGRVLVMVVILELCDPVTMIIKSLPTRQVKT